MRPGAYACRYRVGLVFKRSALTHDQVPQYYFQQLLQTVPSFD